MSDISDYFEKVDFLLLNKHYDSLKKVRELMDKEYQIASDIVKHKMVGAETESNKMNIIDEVILITNVRDRDFKIECDFYGGLITLNNKMIVAPRSRKWRMKGRNKWYRYGAKQQEKLVKKYLLGENWNEAN